MDAPLTLEQFLKLAQQLDPAQRRARWAACGTHHLNSLPETESGPDGARYCLKCYTAFRPDGTFVNPPPGYRATPRQEPG